MFRLLLHAYGEFNRRQPLKRTAWPHFDLLFVHAGRMAIRMDGHEPVELVTGEGILLFPGTPFSAIERGLEARASVQHFEIDSEAKLPGRYSQLSTARSGFLVRRGPRDTDLERDIVRAIAMAEDGDRADRYFTRESLLVLVLDRFLEDKAPVGQGTHDLEGLLEWMRGRAVEDLDSEVLAERLGVSLATLRRRFRTALDMSPTQYLIRLRINEAKRLLAETMSPVKEIATRCGYASAISFHRAFRQATGNTPRTYRIRKPIDGVNQGCPCIRTG